PLRSSTASKTSDKRSSSTKEDKSHLENLQKQIYQLEEQLHSEMQQKDELEHKCRYGLNHHSFTVCIHWLGLSENI
ncbi:hypothetical protein GOODEAATRI_019558, partial [Goodea atripinnis]